MNSGMVAAKNVSVSMKIELANSTTEYHHDQAMIIPAHDGRECFIRSGVTLKTGDLVKLERSDKLLRISGHIAKQEETT